MKRIITLSLLCLLLIFLSALPGYAEEKLKASPWALTELNKANQMGLISFRSKEALQQPIDRKNFAFSAIMALKNIYRVNFDFESKIYYKDIANEIDYRSFIAKAGEYGLIQGDNEGNFNPNKAIRRRDAVVMLSRMSRYFLEAERKLPESPELEAFRKSEEYEKLPAYAKEPVSEFIGLGLLKGVDGVSYHLDEQITAEAAIILAYRYMNYLKSQDNQVFTKEEMDIINEFRNKENELSLIKKFESFKVYADINTKAPSPAVLSDENYHNAINSINRIRLAAGLPAVIRDKDYDYRAAYGALILFATKQFSHYPEQRTLDEKLYKTGTMGTSSSNIGMGYERMDAFNLSCAYDNDTNNYTQLGHRRWLINPNMLKTGFGMAGSYALTYVLDESREPKLKPEVLSYPSKTAFPFDYIKDSPFSIQFGKPEDGDEGYYKIDSKKNPTIELIRLNDNKTTLFKELDLEVTTVDKSLYNVDRANSGYGQALVFRPSHEVKPLDRYRVIIRGLLDAKTGEETSYEYEFILY